MVYNISAVCTGAANIQRKELVFKMTNDKVILA